MKKYVALFIIVIVAIICICFWLSKTARNYVTNIFKHDTDGESSSSDDDALEKGTSEKMRGASRKKRDRSVAQVTSDRMQSLISDINMLQK